MEIKGIEKVVEDSKCLTGRERGLYLQLNYNRETGEVWTDEHYNLGQNDWTEYDNKNIIRCGNICRPVTAKKIREIIESVDRISRDGIGV